jgi:A/G-specific adenine glycosylase
MTVVIPGAETLSAKRLALHRAALRWYPRHGRDLPWRQTRDPWRILVSEVMLQQTQVSRVLERFPVWIARFPTLASHAAATSREALIAWSGMGYNRRALNLNDAARFIAERHGGEIPRDADLLRKLPGIGPYTAHAVLCFAFELRVPIVDVNIRRIFSRIFPRREEDAGLRSEKEALNLAQLLLPPRAFYNWNQALMDIGALICTAREPLCPRCPFRNECASAFSVEWKRNANGTLRVMRTIPRRIHRGRAIEYLRKNRPSHAASFVEIGNALHPFFSKAEHAWLSDILSSLERDRMIVISYKGKRIDPHDAMSVDKTRLRISLSR